MVDEKPKSETPKLDAAEEKTMIDEAREQADRMEKANAERKALIERDEKLQARRMLGGTSEAGTAPVAPKEETAQEYAKRVMGGNV